MVVFLGANGCVLGGQMVVFLLARWSYSCWLDGRVLVC